jgi:cell division GTPase FtsZ
VNAAAEVIYDLVDPTANLIFGAVIDPSLTGQVSWQRRNNCKACLFVITMVTCNMEYSFSRKIKIKQNKKKGKSQISEDEMDNTDRLITLAASQL